MGHYTVQQCIEIIRIYHQNSLSDQATFRAPCEIYGQHYRSTERPIRRIAGKYEMIGSVVDQSMPVGHRNARSDENIAAVRESVSDNPNLSIPRRAQELELSRTSTWRILRKDLGFFPTSFN